MLLKPWQTLRESVPFENRWVRVRLQTVRLPDGQEYEYSVVDRPLQGVAIFLLDEENRLLLEREYRHAVGEVLWQLPGGLMEPDESPLHGAQRELLEESGYRATQWEELGTVYDNPGLGNAASTLFLARDPLREGDPTPDHAEWVELEWVSLAWLREAIARDQIVDRVILSGVAMLWARGLLDADA